MSEKDKQEKETLGKGLESPTPEKKETVDIKETVDKKETKVKEDKITDFTGGTVSVKFCRRWLRPNGQIAEIGDVLNVDKDTYEMLYKNKIIYKEGDK